MTSWSWVKYIFIFRLKKICRQRKRWQPILPSLLLGHLNRIVLHNRQDSFVSMVSVTLRLNQLSVNTVKTLPWKEDWKSWTLHHLVSKGVWPSGMLSMYSSKVRMMPLGVVSTYGSGNMHTWNRKSWCWTICAVRISFQRRSWLIKQDNAKSHSAQMAAWLQGKRIQVLNVHALIDCWQNKGECGSAINVRLLYFELCIKSGIKFKGGK